jgi:hypothetical protein
LVVPPLQLGVTGPYLVWGIWFPIRLQLEGTEPYPIFLGRNQRPAIPEVRDPERCILFMGIFSTIKMRGKKNIYTCPPKLDVMNELVKIGNIRFLLTSH